MAQSIRQRNLFAAEDFTVIYDSFKQSNFQAYDFDTIRVAMVDYIRSNYPENFNDWIQSSEFVSLIELIAFLGHNLAFRADLAGRENFLSTAERRESVLRIADFLGYKPSRSLPSRGLLKIQTIKTSQNIYDVDGKSLKGRTIKFFDEQNESSYSNFILVLNEVLNSDNRFGHPNNSTSIGGIKTDIYASNSVSRQSVTYPFSAKINGTPNTFEIHSADVTNSNTLVEATPDPLASFNLVYRNDNHGLGSNDTGFFVGFKQGSLRFDDFDATTAISNLSIDLGANGVNNIDTWVQTINSSGNILENWTKADNTFGVSALYNTLQNGNRKIFSVQTRDDDDISVEFGDGVFSEIPRGIIRIWYRSGENQSYTLNPDDIGTVAFGYSYIGSDNNEYKVSFTAKLDRSINNASARESINSIRQNAGRVFAAQDRMVTAEDYSVLPLTVSNNIIKVKSVNRTHSGHSRFVNINDPTATYQNAKLNANDGYIFGEQILYKKSISLPTTLTSKQMFDTHIKDIIEHPEIINLFYKEYQPLVITGGTFVWQQVSKSHNSSTGYFTNGGIVTRIGNSATTGMKDIKVGAIVEFSDTSGNLVWARVASTYDDGLGVDDVSGYPTGRDPYGKGAVVLSKLVPTSATAVRVFYSFSTKFPITTQNEIIENLNYNIPFGLRFDTYQSIWVVVKEENLPTLNPLNPALFDLTNAGSINATHSDGSWIIRFGYSSQQWTIYSRRFRIVFGSESEIRFFNQNANLQFNSETNKPERDSLRIFKTNTAPESASPLGKDVEFFAYKYYTEADGHSDSHKFIVTVADVDNDSYPDNPMAFQFLVGNDLIGIGEIVEDGFSYTVYDENVAQNISGRNDLMFQWKRVADTKQRIDPSISNIIDTFVLSDNYDRNFREWLKNDRSVTNKPTPPTSDALKTQFALLDKKKSISDSIIYRSAKYKLLFGETADYGVQARFKIVKIVGTTLNDGEIKSRALTAIIEFFDVNSWDFGETFYFTELAAYVHNRLLGIISSIVIVPINENGAFGNLFQVTPDSDELFIPDITLSNIDIVENISGTSLRASSRS